MAETVSVIATSKVDDVLRDFKKISKEQAKINKGFQNIAKGSKKAGKNVKEGFGGGVAGQFKSLALGIGSVATALATVTEALSLANKTSRESFQSFKSVEQSRNELLQLGGAQNFARLEGVAKRLSVGSGMEVQDAYKLAFSLESLGYTSGRQIDLAGKASGSVNSGAIFDITKQVQSTFGSANVENVGNIIMAGAKKSRFNVNQLAPTVPKALTQFSQFGGFQEFMGLQSQFADLAESPEVGSTRFQGLLTALSKQQSAIGFTKADSFKSVMQKVGETVAGKSQADKISFFGRKEGLIAFEQYQKPSFAKELAIKERAIEEAVLKTGTQQSDFAKLGTDMQKISAPFIRERKARAKKFFTQLDSGMIGRGAEIETEITESEIAIGQAIDEGKPVEAFLRSVVGGVSEKFQGAEGIRKTRATLFERDSITTDSSLLDMLENILIPKYPDRDYPWAKSNTVRTPVNTGVEKGTTKATKVVTKGNR